MSDQDPPPVAGPAVAAPPGPVTADRRLSPLTPVVRAAIVLIAFVSASWQRLLDQGSPGITGVLLVGLLVVGAVYGFASWLRTRYRIDGDELRIETGVLSRQSRRIRIDRLQGVDIVQPLLARLFGLAELRFDVASGVGREGTLAFLRRSEAEALRQLLLERRDDLLDDLHDDLRLDPAQDVEPGPEPGPDLVPAQGQGLGPGPGRLPGTDAALLERRRRPAPVPERELARLDPGRLLASLALSTETLLLGGAAIGLAVGYLASGTFVVAGGLVPTLLGLAIALGRRLSAYHGFRLSESASGLQVRRGLTALTSQTVAPARVQGLVITQPLLWRPLGWARLDVSVAGNLAGDPRETVASSTLMPVAPLPEVLALLQHVLGGRDATRVRLVAPPRRSRWLAPFTAWAMACGQDADLVVSRRGFLVRRLDVVPQERIQSSRVRQGPLQRRLALADVHLDSPPGPVRLVCTQRDTREARAFLGRAVELQRAARHRPAGSVGPLRPAHADASVTAPAP